jgi:threonylcarbamoyladenosine tRNA methylthiotransferase MtaB
LPRNEFTIDSVGFYDHSTRANLKLQDGCNFFCSYCIIPQARGRARSRRFEDVLLEAGKLVESGHQELVLTGINIGTYKSDGKRLLQLIPELERIPGLRRIRISSIEPTTVSHDLIRLIADSEKVCRHLHLPLQSGDDSMLRRMRRRHTAAQFAEFVEWTLKKVPDIGIGTDVLVGFPGEGDEQFKNTKKLVADLEIPFFHVFTYSDRLGTKAYEMPDKVDPQTKKLRTRIMIELGQRQQYAFYERFVGCDLDILFEDRNRGDWVGFADNYIRVQVRSDADLHNRIVKTRLTGIEGDHMLGEPLS